MIDSEVRELLAAMLPAPRPRRPTSARACSPPAGGPNGSSAFAS
jgi:hypothetical protein